MHDAFKVSHAPVVSGIKDKVDSLLLYGGKLYIGCQNGTLHVYKLETSSEGTSSAPSATLDKTIKAFSKKSIEQLAVVKEINSLVTLSDGTIYLHDLHTYHQQTVLGASSQTKGQAGLFTINTSIESNTRLPSRKGKDRERQPTPLNSKRAAKGKIVKRETEHDQDGAPSVVTTMAVGCRRRLVLFSWRDGQWQDPKEVALPHQVRSIAFPLPQTIFLGFSTSEYGTVSLDPSKEAQSTSPASNLGPVLSEVDTPTFPPPSGQSPFGSFNNTSSSSTGGLPLPGFGGFGGLAARTTGYMSLGLVRGNKVEKNIVVKTRDGEVLIMKDGVAILLDSAGEPSRSKTTSGPGSDKNTVEYVYEPEEFVACWPYLIAVLPAPMTAVGQSNLTKQQQFDPCNSVATLQVHSIPSLSSTQVIKVPPLENVDSNRYRPASHIDVPASPITQTARLLTTGPNGKSPLAILTQPASDPTTYQNTQNPPSPTDKQTRIYLLQQLPWSEQIASIISSGSYPEALSLTSALPNPAHLLPDHVNLMKRLKVLSALSQFLESNQHYDSSIDVFIDENVTPAKVISLFPRNISGKLYVERSMVEQVWGGRSREEYEKAVYEHEASKAELSSGQLNNEPRGGWRGKANPRDEVAASTGTSWRFSPARGKAGAGNNDKGEDTASVRSVKGTPSQVIGPTIATESEPGANLSGSLKDKEGSIVGSTKTIEQEGTNQSGMSSKVSVDVLMRYLPDRRQQFLRALSSIPPISRPTPSTITPLTYDSLDPDELFSFPDAPLSTYNTDQLIKTAQIVETALFKCYLYSKPGLLGPLCRIENWCIVEEVEELLLEAKKYRELLDLYNGKRMHEKALKLLQRMAQDLPEDTPLSEKVEPTITYLQKLGPQNLDLIFSGAKWVFSQSLKSTPVSAPARKADTTGLDIFIGDLEEIESLPRYAVSNFLSTNSPNKEIYKRYLEFIINDLNESSPEFHERLCEIYLDELEEIGAKGSDEDARYEEEYDKLYRKLINFLETSTQYRPERLLGRISKSTNESIGGVFDEVRAILLGKLGQHEGALAIYVYKLGDTKRAEEYCRRVFASEDAASSVIFLTLLRVYLRPRRDQLLQKDAKTYVSDAASPMFEAALSLLSRHSTKFSPDQVLDILPPLLTISSLETFLLKTIRKNLNDSKRSELVRRDLMQCRLDQVSEKLVDLEERRVKITDSRLCPMCKKRLGGSAIAVHHPHGEVTHYNCRERWIEAKYQLGY